MLNLLNEKVKINGGFGGWNLQISVNIGKVSKLTSGASKNKVLIKIVSNISISQGNLSK